MPHFLIKIINCLLLVVILIGVPAITHAQLGDWQIASASKARALIFYGLVLAAAGNAMLAMFLKKHKDQILCWEWAAVFGGLLAAQYAYTNGYLSFDWLKKILLWLQTKL
ncbi:MAG TPA: hypothetical protein VIK53_19695 [Verrucomicrobiae bacterium]